jgi:hypothetical protein
MISNAEGVVSMSVDPSRTDATPLGLLGFSRFTRGSLSSAPFFALRCFGGQAPATPG